MGGFNPTKKKTVSPLLDLWRFLAEMAFGKQMK